MTGCRRTKLDEELLGTRATGLAAGDILRVQPTASTDTCLPRPSPKEKSRSPSGLAQNHDRNDKSGTVLGTGHGRALELSRCTQGWNELLVTRS